MMSYLNYILCIVIVILTAGIIYLLFINKKIMDTYMMEIEKIAAGDISLD